MDQVLTRRDPLFGDEKKTKSGGPVPMDLDALQISQKSGEHFDAMDSGEQHSNVVGDEQSSDTAELNALRMGGFPGKCQRQQHQQHQRQQQMDIPSQRLMRQHLKGL